MVNFTRGCKIDVYVSVAMVTLHHLPCCRSWKLHYWPNCRVTLTLSLTCVKLCVLRSFKHSADARFKGTCVYEKCGTHVPLTLQIKIPFWRNRLLDALDMLSLISTFVFPCLSDVQKGSVLWRGSTKRGLIS